MTKHWLHNDYSKCVVYSHNDKVVVATALSITNSVVNIMAGSKNNPLTVKEKTIKLSPDNSIKALQNKLNTYIGKPISQLKSDVKVMGWTAWGVTQEN